MNRYFELVRKIQKVFNQENTYENDIQKQVLQLENENLKLRNILKISYDNQNDKSIQEQLDKYFWNLECENYEHLKQTHNYNIDRSDNLNQQQKKMNNNDNINKDNQIQQTIKERLSKSIKQRKNQEKQIQENQQRQFQFNLELPVQNKGFDIDNIQNEDQ
ncbi:hypothetical protein PPERSA_07634 [Pseudocohnilembus persalinus]|uniref:Uncharacterized protein n=1 Tax=Pseudocohnilembus persalinus TaxID=266149 RepID=A0A0V0QIX7_PSEPJ|nr:hypothetical protein PPERSA_07634 [Pseudocohnilembus persalinus]|eukprot:KRX01989.1 hypothetical protein PPERSA_07634 [Pseudocohnilembus persalinus]